ncbi:MAG TPA: hypothetical protein VE643_04680 [Nitrososphaeraceae archaeon]|nr:hypothetical protein [Nitrososphaeraceae archaeon]
MILKGKLVVIAMVITSLAFVVAAVAASSSVAVSISSLGRRLLKSVRPPPNGLIPPYRLLSGYTLPRTQFLTIQQN